MDFVRLALLSGGFGLLLAAHVVLLAGLAWQKPRTRALLALLVPPFAPYFGFKEGRRGWSTVWVAAVVVYGAGVVATGS
jgi:hypothetical protein